MGSLKVVLPNVEHQTDIFNASLIINTEGLTVPQQGDLLLFLNLLLPLFNSYLNHRAAFMSVYHRFLEALSEY